MNDRPGHDAKLPFKSTCINDYKHLSSHSFSQKVQAMEIFKVLQHVATPCQEPFTGSDIRRVVWQTTDKDQAEQYADVANLTNGKVWVKCYSVSTTILSME